MINIHPGPLPEFGGKGLYGYHVHNAVASAFKRGEITHTAVSMHFVTEKYDQGPVFFRCLIKINPNDTADKIEIQVKEQEHLHQARIINMVVNGQIKWDGINPDSLEVPANYSIDCHA